MRQLRVGIVGCGCIFTMHATSAKILPMSKIVAVCDVKSDRAETAGKKYGAAVYTDYMKMFDAERLDAVHLCVPHYLHHVIARAALEHGINVLCEKPIAIRFEDGEANVRLAREKGLKYGVIFQCRYNDASRAVKRFLDGGELGRVLSARVVLTWSKPDSYYGQSDWKGTWDKEGGGVIIDQAIHSLDLANWFIGDEVVRVRAKLSNRHHRIMEVDDTGEGLIEYRNGATLGFWAMNNYGCDEPIEIRLCCERGHVSMSYDDAVITFDSGRTITVRQGADSVEYENGKDYWGFQHIRQIEDFYRSILENREPEISGEEALKIQRIISAIYENGNFSKDE